ncbi:MarR family winged helix-turn-helix transcriptional regulator [Bifidobacterium choloepi]|uniref:Winged helix DNA-binding protein n=1 Tax=Bifidobacterium choloepi TaxID=2614131 RepID=A0A6I5N169_9BIFI|nr:winged helix DNA-binding protein [Bifidobacterium choloepi]NEG69875.1 winged helix DNA-binding protein [Bifidobacterium choloepi]
MAEPNYAQQALIDLMAVFGSSHSKVGATMQRTMHGEAFVMRTLALKGPQTPSHLAVAMNVTPGRVSSVLASLTKKGWIERVEDEKDRRSVHVRLTDAGYESFRDHSVEMRDDICWIFSQMGERRTKAFVDLATEFITYLSLIGPGKEMPPTQQAIEAAFEERDRRIDAAREDNPDSPMRKLFGLLEDED